MHTRRPWFAIALFLLAPGFSQVRADEGMWPLDQLEALPIPELKQRGMALPPRAIREAARAVVKIGGGTGSFVSGDGLILTNHHVAYQCISTNSDVGKDILDAGFLARSRADEIRCRGLEVLEPVETRDVTADVQKREDEALPPEQQYKQREARRNQLATACQAGRDDRRCQVALFHGGARELLLTYHVLRDIRLVHAPEAALGVFGGDTDNFEWPRCTADYAFLRAYAGPKGESRTFDPGNVPYQPPVHLTVSFDGYEEGSFVVILGYPGATDRRLPAALLERQIESDLPNLLERYRSRIRILSERAASDPETRLRVVDQLRGLTNSEKNIAGRLAGLQRLHPVEARRKLEQELSRWIAADPRRRASYGDVFKEIDKAVAAQAKDQDLRRALDDLARSARSLDWAHALYERSVERARPDDERRDPYHERQQESLRQRVVESPVRLVPAVEEDLLASFIERALALPSGQRVAAVARRAAGRKGPAADVARAIAKEILGGTKIADREARRKYFDMTSAELEGSGDTLLAFMAEVHRQERPLLDRLDREVTAPLAAARPRYARALLEFNGGSLYPDANGTLRFSFGKVAGYWPAPSGSRRPYATTVDTLLATATNHPDYKVREEVRTQLSTPVGPPLMDVNLGVGAVNFIADADIIGGNSGSPALDGTGQVIGCVFDSNYEALAQRYVYDADQDRAIMVDIRFVAQLMVDVYGAADLAREIGFRP